ncbi:unnamed protein product [Euphydryas editha]|uniref:Uncharacterized protein n=1 Tax=Euphydryas editha TaxID=104508 RepID=A0AAU9TNU2_EUPED|nr:unnamed protein product [Euphydryas editha]
MADKCERVDTPDELEQTDGKEAVQVKAKDIDNIKVASENIASPTNAIIAPDNCPPGQQRGVDGVCRDVF